MSIENIRAGDLRGLLRERSGQIEIVDVRGKDEYAVVHIRGSKSIPMAELPGRIGEIDWDKEIVFVCKSGRRSQLISKMVAASGRDVKNLSFGIYECFQDGQGEFLEGSQGEAERYF